MERQLSHLVRLVDDLMEVSRITRGKVELRKEPARLDAALRSAIEACEPLIRAGGHRLNLSLPPDPIVLDADPVRLAQVFGNLLNNAAKYTEHGGAISVAARAEGLEAVVSIADTGDGIAPESLPQLFEMFFRGSESARRNQSGLGIGLALVRRLVEMHGGRVDAQSEGAGKGSRFTVRLPLDPALQPAPAAVKLERAALAPLTILVVDDNQDAAESMRLLLRQVGADVRVAHDGPRRSRPSTPTGRAWCCWTSACPAWTATRWRAACAPRPTRRRLRSSRSPAGARTRTGSACARRASTTTSSSPPTSARYSRSSPRSRPLRPDEKRHREAREQCRDLELSLGAVPLPGHRVDELATKILG